MYSNIDLKDGWRYLCVTINDRTYILGRTGRYDWCQDLSRTRSDLN